ncbi:signal peptidase I [Kitasatospora sp. NPDC056531]|uniref:signal peptidase I n=1 Tax=Kitasatospora sp. NPDC056531 TaxID=3345856 RepID=UPI0036C272FF
MRTRAFRGSRRRVHHRAARVHHRAARGRAERRRVARRAVRRRKRARLRELPLVTLVALVLALALKTFLMQVFVIPSGSMQNTLGIGDRVVVDKLSPWFGGRPHRGDVVVFQDPGGWLEADRQNASDGPVLRTVKAAFSFLGLLPSDDRQDLVKRVIGVDGDTVACCDDHGRITVNGVALNDPYLAPGNAPSRQAFDVTVPMGRIWVMGDHRDVSADSRYHMGSPGQGTIPLTSVVGRAVAIVWPVPRIRHLDAPAPPPRCRPRPKTGGALDRLPVPITSRRNPRPRRPRQARSCSRSGGGSRDGGDGSGPSDELILRRLLGDIAAGANGPSRLLRSNTPLFEAG